MTKIQPRRKSCYAVTKWGKELDILTAHAEKALLRSSGIKNLD